MKIDDITTSNPVGYFVNNSGLDDQLFKKNDNDAGQDLCVDLLSPFTIYSKDQELIIENDHTYEGEDLEVVLPARSRGVFNTRVKVQLPEGHVGLVWDRSGLAAKNGITILAGCVDEGYRGYVKIVILNTSYIDFVVKDGMRMAQLLCIPCNMHRFVEVDSLDETARDTRAFGSSGV